MTHVDAYQDDLAYIHDAGFGGFARGSSPGLLSLFRQNGITSGIWARALADSGYEVVGVDVSPAMIELARHRVPEATFHVQSFLKFPMPACRAVTALGEVFNYLLDPKNSVRTLRQVAYLEWFRSLPMWLDLDGLRGVHACWDEQAVKEIGLALEERPGITNTLLLAALKKGNALFAPVEVVLKGKEAALPEGVSFLDRDGHARTEIRSRWYLSPRGQTYRTHALQSDEIPCDLALEESVIASAAPYPTTPSRCSSALLALGAATRNPGRERGLP